MRETSVALIAATLMAAAGAIFAVAPAAQAASPAAGVVVSPYPPSPSSAP
ncbi:hypothetical protein ACFQX7_30245 [Luedemannella flava]